MAHHYLDQLFSPRAVAVIGASKRPETVGARVLHNLREAGFTGALYPVNPKYRRLYGLHCYPDIAAIGEPVDLAVIATPALTVPALIHACGEQGVGAVAVLSAGFGEAGGEQGMALKEAVLAELRHYDMRLLGPNCLGLIRPGAHLNASFSHNHARPGSLALVSQSGALCTAILDWAETQEVGFSAMVSLGDALDIDFGDVLDYLAMDPATRGILLYVEGIHDARRFMSGLRAAARLKPVVVVKAGRHQEGHRAALSHTGAMLAADDVFDAALQRAGAVRAMTISQLFATARLLASGQRIQGNRLAIITNAGGPGVMATDRAVDLGVALAQLEAGTLVALERVLSDHWSRANPVDILGDASPAHYHAAVEACLHDKQVDGVLVMLTPQAMTRPLEAAQAVIEACAGQRKPVLTCWMGERQVVAGRTAFAAAHIPSFRSPEASVEAFAYLTMHYRNQQLLRQVPGPLSASGAADVEGARLIIDSALGEGRSVLSAAESRALLSAFAIPVMPMYEATTANEALVAAESIGFPVVLKVNSPDISHKTDVDGVRLNINSAQAVRSAFQDLMHAVAQQRPDAQLEGVTVERMVHMPHGRELLVGIARDPVFGPVISFGAGGTAVEILRDRAVALPPLNTFLSDDLIGRTRIARLLEAWRNLPAVNRTALHQVLRRVSEMACELPELLELDINPLMIDEQGAIAVDARVRVTRITSPPRAAYEHMAVHPYPSHLIEDGQLDDGTPLTVRPIRPEDATIEQDFVRRLSPEAKYFRFMQRLHELTPEMLVRFTQIDYDREMALIAVTRSEQGEETELGVARYVINPDGESCEFALVVDDRWRHRGIGSRLMRALMNVARSRGISCMEGEVLAENAPMLDLVARLGFTLQRHPDDPTLKHVIRQL